MDSIIITYKNFEEIPEEEKKLIIKAEQATQNSYAPYSNFNVGAALLLDDGSTVIGANQENAASPAGLCAERVALFSFMNSYSLKKVKKIAVTARKENTATFLPVSPCGGCRQVMLEQEQIQNNNIEVLFKTNGNWIKVSTISTLLPFSFDKNTLK